MTAFDCMLWVVGPDIRHGLIERIDLLFIIIIFQKMTKVDWMNGWNNAMESACLILIGTILKCINNSLIGIMLMINQTELNLCRYHTLIRNLEPLDEIHSLNSEISPKLSTKFTRFKSCWAFHYLFIFEFQINSISFCYSIQWNLTTQIVTFLKNVFELIQIYPNFVLLNEKKVTQMNKSSQLI